MKKRILFVVAMYWLLGNPLFSQSLEQRVLEQLSTLDQSQTTTGILYERSLHVQPLKLLDGKTLNDSIQLSPNDFAFGFGLLQWAYIDTIHRQLIDPFFELVATKKNQDTIPIGLLCYQYDRIKPWAIDSGLITYNNDHFYDVQGRPESPYLVDTTFAMAIFNTLIYNLQPLFRFDSSLFRHNLLSGISSIEINFSDGAGWISISPGAVMTPIYSDYGKFNIELRISLSNGVTRWCRQVIELKASSSGIIFPPEGEYSIFPDDSIKIGAPGEGVMVYVFLRDKCGDKKIRKPFIIIEGFDPANKYNWQFAMHPSQGILNQKYEQQNNLSNYLNLEDYDIFFINYMKPGDYIQNNAAAVIAAIAEINHRKHLAGSVEKNVVMGASMGGLVGKYALRTMELQNVDHETEFFLSFDSPLKGANVPLGLQAMVFQLANFTVFGGKLKDKKEDLKNAYDAVNMPAAKQMLFYHYSACDQAEISKGVINCSGETFGQYHTEFQTMFDGLGNLDIPHYAIWN